MRFPGFSCPIAPLTGCQANFSAPTPPVLITWPVRESEELEIESLKANQHYQTEKI